MNDALLSAFEVERPHLMAVAYRMLGSVTEAEDVVQSAWVKLRTQEAVEPVREPRAYLTTVVVRLALDSLRSARVRREAYVGPWLPEPVLTEPDAAFGGEPRDLSSLSFAFLILLEALSPLERAAFLLHEVFDWTAPEIGRVLERDDAAIRQLVRRARAHVSDGAPRFPPSKEEHQALLNGFLTTMGSGDVNALAAMLAADVVVRSDGGGVVKAARKVVAGADHCAKLLVGVMRHMDFVPELSVREVNGSPSLVWRNDGKMAGVMSLTIEAGQVKAVDLVLVPEKLRYLAL
jgi:RNA polymerase sigma-70 factor (ECF subfamily)